MAIKYLVFQSFLKFFLKAIGTRETKCEKIQT